jgi:hypothetical protein
MDEGLNSYATGRFLDRRYGRNRSALGFRALGVGQLAVSRFGVGLGGAPEPLETRAWEFRSFQSYAFHSYMRTDLALRTLRGWVGERAMERALRTYATRRRFTHPTPEDFLSDLAGVLGHEPVDAVLRPLLHSGASVDYAVEEVKATERIGSRGIFDRDAGPEKVLDAGPAVPAEWESEVVVTRRGPIALPVDVRVVFEGGRAVCERWDGRGPFVRFAYRSARPVESAEVDPDRRIALDLDLRNNGRGRERGGARHVLSRALYAIATLLQVVGP